MVLRSGVSIALAAAFAAAGLINSTDAQQARAQSTTPQGRAPSGQKPDIAQALELQVRLDRAGFSPGEIDGVEGRNTTQALEALKRSGRSPGDEPLDSVVQYAITNEDVAGPFTQNIPADMMAKSKLDALNYTSPLEALGEKFHASPALLKKLNPEASFTAGETVFVPNITPRGFGDAKSAPAGRGAQAPEGAGGKVRIVVSKRSSALQVLDEKGGVLFHAPVTSGSEHDPLPIGKWAVTAVARKPAFNYNPDLFWDANPAHAKAKIPPGPNNPVGLVWIDLTKEHYGIHGTPEPGKIGHTESHGCVRLTNWDALHVASLVGKGTVVVFEQ